MQGCVDRQVGEVLGLNAGQQEQGTGLRWQGSGAFWDNTIIIFTSDHGDYAGSHGLHDKGGALYEESINVPLFVSYPQFRGGSPSAPVVLPYVCSSVDLLPLIYTLALGNPYWRSNNNDMVYYLNCSLMRYVNLPSQWTARSGCGFDTFLIEGYQYPGINHNLDQANRCAQYPWKELSWDQAHSRHLMGLYYATWPWLREFVNVNRLELPAIKLWAYDHLCLFGWPAPLPTTDDRSFIY